MSTSLRVLRTAFVAALLLSALSSQAQTVPPVTPVPAAPTSYTIGVQDNTFSYLRADSSFVYRFDAASQAFMISGTGSYLLVSYGTQMADSAAAVPSLSMVQLAVGLGGQSNLFDHVLGLPVRGFLPTQLQLDYRHVTARDTDLEQSRGDDVEALHLAAAGLALGVGAEARLPKLIPVLEDRLAARGMLLLGAGATTNVATEFEELGLMGKRELHLEVRLERVLGNRTGVTLGYVYRQQNWALGTPESVQDVLDAFLEPGTLDQKSTQHLVRIGLNF